VKKLLFLALAAVVLTFALVLISCGVKCQGGGGCGYAEGTFLYNWCAPDTSTDRIKVDKAQECYNSMMKQIEEGKKAFCDC